MSNPERILAACRIEQLQVSAGPYCAALIGECALKAKAAVLLTFNAEHFSHLEAAGIRVVVPLIESK